MVQATKSCADLKALYGDAYVARYRAQPPERLARLLPYIQLRPTACVADFGCGNGMLYDLIGHRVREYVGVDFSESFIRAARERVNGARSRNAQFVCSSIEAFCATRPASMDAAFAMDFSEHVYDDEWHEILRSIRSVLKPGGALYLHTPNAAFIVERLKARNFILAQQPEHIAVRTASENCRLLREAGFDITTARVLPHYLPVMRRVHALTVLPGLGRLFGARLFIEAQRAEVS
jgi:2-polyprenyl-6-hydroxyphenyl methylase / 3-demethylubiquinone-9 3-methyltransferase